MDRLPAAGGDTTEVEVKSAAGGLPESLTATLSALANLPGGGTVILGLDERAAFRPVHLDNPQALKQGLASKARSFVPPVHLTIGDGTVEGRPVVVARVHECDRSAKPCRVATTGTAYLRGYDGDFELSSTEEQGFLTARRSPHFDRERVEGATRDDLDVDLIGAFVAAVRERDPHGLGRFRSDDELLRRAGVTVNDGQPTVAGLLALQSESVSKSASQAGRVVARALAFAGRIRRWSLSPVLGGGGQRERKSGEGRSTQRAQGSGEGRALLAHGIHPAPQLRHSDRFAGMRTVRCRAAGATSGPELATQALLSVTRWGNSVQMVGDPHICL